MHSNGIVDERSDFRLSCPQTLSRLAYNTSKAAPCDETSPQHAVLNMLGCATPKSAGLTVRCCVQLHMLL